jgi:hypothetical protein
MKDDRITLNDDLLTFPKQLYMLGHLNITRSHNLPFKVGLKDIS